jgi:hypothetical protein
MFDWFASEVLLGAAATPFEQPSLFVAHILVR